MASLFRPSSPADAPEIVALAERCLGVSRQGPMFAAEQLAWKYWTRSAGQPSSSSHVLVRDGRIIAHAGVWPLTVRRDGERIHLLHPFDWMSEPSAIGSGAVLLQRLSQLADGLLIVGGSQTTQRMVGPLGFRSLDDVVRYAAPVNATRATHLEPDGGLAVHPLAEPTGLDVEAVDPAEPWLAFERTPGQLDFCRRCPAAPMSIYAVKHGDARVGGFVLARAPGQARLAAFWASAPRAENSTQIVRLALRQVRQDAGAAEVVSMTSEPLEQQTLADAGFNVVGRVPMFLRTAHPALSQGARLSFQMLDGDLWFLHHGGADPWL